MNTFVNIRAQACSPSKGRAQELQLGSGQITPARDRKLQLVITNTHGHHRDCRSTFAGPTLWDRRRCPRFAHTTTSWRHAEGRSLSTTEARALGSRRLYKRRWPSAYGCPASRSTSIVEVSKQARTRIRMRTRMGTRNVGVLESFRPAKLSHPLVGHLDHPHTGPGSRKAYH